jgi:FR47-like protein
MKYPKHGKLDNPVWHSLGETHRGFSIDYGSLKCYDPAFCPFGGYKNGNDSEEGLDRYAKLINNFFIVGHKPKFSRSLVLKNELICLQMIIDRNPGVMGQEEIIRLNHNHEEALFELVNLVQPGYFKNNTSQLGDYYGIFQNGNLVAATGERMQMDDFVEVSAIVTNHDKIPYLHVAESNTVAINLYKKLGFEIRQKISFWNIISLQ